MKLKRAFFLITCFSLLVSLLLVLLVKMVCDTIREQNLSDGMTIYLKYTEDNTDISPFEVVYNKEEQDNTKASEILAWLDYIWILSCVWIPAFGMAMAGAFFYYIKCEKPIRVLREGTQQIQNHNLDFQISVASKDELGQLCVAFEMMRVKLLQTNQELWQQAEERKRLNAAFSHDLRNPVTVLKGTVKMLRQGIPDEQAIDRLECYTLRIEQYVEAMSSIQRFEQMPVQIGEVESGVLEAELKETAQVLASNISVEIFVSFEGKIRIDHGIVLTVAENLIGNARRYAWERITIAARVQNGYFILTVADDGSGYPSELIQNGPKPFGKIGESAEHFGMGLYSCQLLCMKHGGELQIENMEEGALATAVFQIKY